MGVAFTLKNILYISLLLISFGTLAQEKNSSPTSEKKLHFEDIKIESEAPEKYKTLEIRYQKFLSPDQKEIQIGQELYKCFQDKQSAVRYYFAVKKDAPEKIVYYVYNIGDKKPEIITFRIE